MFPFVLPGFAFDRVYTVAQKLLVHAHSIALTARCPHGQHPATRLHSRYQRIPRDLPSGEYRVQLHLTIPRFFCDQPACPQRTFTERLPDFLPVHAQRTTRLTTSLQHLGLALGGETGARLGARLRMQTSPDTLLRIVRQVDTPRPARVRVVGVDDFALKKGHHYGTLLVDLERNRPIDMLPDPSADTLATWLRDQTGIEVIVRDRSTEYARGATIGAPEAQQVADRWHVLQNLREALERMCGRLHAQLHQLPVLTQAGAATHGDLAHVQALRPASAGEHAVRAARRATRHACYEHIRTLAQAGVPHLHIARDLKISRTTVRRFAIAEQFPERAARVRQPRMLDQYLPYLEQRWRDGCTNASQVWRELQAHGYRGARKQVARWVRHQRTAAALTAPKKDTFLASSTAAGNQVQPSRMRLGTPRRLAWLLLDTRRQTSAEEACWLNRIRQHPLVEQAREVAQAFQSLLRGRTSEGFNTWLEACASCGVAELRRLRQVCVLTSERFAQRVVKHGARVPWKGRSIA